MPSMFPYNCSHMWVTWSKDQEIMSINLKSTFTKTNNHVMVNCQLKFNDHNYHAYDHNAYNNKLTTMHDYSTHVLITVLIN